MSSRRAMVLGRAWSCLARAECLAHAACAVLAGCAVFVGCFAVIARSALAAPTDLAALGERAGEVNDPRGVAIDQASGDIYVADGNNFRIDKFGPAGNFLMSWGYGVADGKTLALQGCGPEATPPTSQCYKGEGANTAKGPGAVHPTSIAVDQSTGDVYVADNLRVEKFSSDGQFLLMFGKDVDTTAGTLHPNLCAAADLAAGDTCGAGVSGTGAGQFSANKLPIAVDASGDVWVGDENRLEELDSSGGYVSEVALAGAGEVTALALSASGDFYVESTSLAGVRKLEPAGGLIEALDAGGSPKALDVDPSSGAVFVSDQVSPASAATLIEYDSTGAEIESFATGQVIGAPYGDALALGESARALYVASNGTGTHSAVQRFSLPQPGPLVEGQHAEALAPTAATLAAELDAEGHTTTYHFEYGLSDSYGEQATTATLPGSGFGEEAVEASVSHLIPATTYHFRLVAEDSEGHIGDGPDTTFTTQPAVQIGAQWVTGVATGEVTFEAQLDPLSAPATWWVEYGPTATYGTSTPEASLAAEAGEALVSASVQGLQPAATYHYRFVARGEREGLTYTVYGPDEAFTTQLAGVFGSLPDGRAWELVSPPNKSGALIEPIDIGTIQAAEDGDAITYAANAPVGSGAVGNRAPEWDQVLSSRVDGQWRSQDIETPDFAMQQGGLPEEEGGAPTEYRLFSSDLQLGVVEPRGDTPLSPKASERTLYLRHDDAEPEALYEPLVTSKEGYANVPTGTVFGGDPGYPHGALRFQAATPDLSHIELTSEVPLVVGGATNGLYEWSGGSLQPVSLLPAAEGGAMVGVGHFYLTVTRHGISNDGSRLVWPYEKHLYVRDMETQETTRLDTVQPGATGVGKQEAIFQAASADGSRVFFTDSQQLTVDSTAAEGDSDLYVYETTSGGGSSLTDLTADRNADEDANVQGTVLGSSEDGSYVYFVANGMLASGARRGNCTRLLIAQQSSASCNLYVDHYDGSAWTTSFIASLSNEDELDWDHFVGLGETLGGVVSRVSPDGHYLAFMSDVSLTGYDNRDAVSGASDEEVFLYDAGTARTACASCNPAGARPLGILDGQGRAGEAVDRFGYWGNRWMAANMPGWTAFEAFGFAIYQSRILSSSGRLFFDSSDALAPQDSNGTEDVYEYEPPGVGDCSRSSTTFSAGSGGCVGLVSSGTAAEESAFIDASAGGNDVFFLSTAKLSALDTDSAYDVYDTHVCEAASPCAAPPAASPRACTTADSCRAASSPQPEIFGAPPSQTFSGAGNLTQSKQVAQRKSLTRAQKLARRLKKCKQKPKRKRARCRRRVEGRHGARPRAKRRRRTEGKHGARPRVKRSTVHNKRRGL